MLSIGSYQSMDEDEANVGGRLWLTNKRLQFIFLFKFIKDFGPLSFIISFVIADINKNYLTFSGKTMAIMHTNYRKCKNGIE